MTGVPSRTETPTEAVARLERRRARLQGRARRLSERARRGENVQAEGAAILSEIAGINAAWAVAKQAQWDEHRRAMGLPVAAD